jgi:uncharacterized protein YlxW (UPF0749 family)
MTEPDRTQDRGGAHKGPTGPRRRLLATLRPRATRGQLLAGLLCAVLGFALVVQVRQNQTQSLSTLRQNELVALLDRISGNSAALDREARRLQTDRDRLRSGAAGSAAAAQAAQERLDVLAILAGTVPAAGPGITLEIADPQRRVSAAILLDTLQELRDAGAEAVQVGQVRVVASTSFADTSDGVQADGQLLDPPYLFRAIGDPDTLSAALAIPGGVLDVLKQQQAVGDVQPRTAVTVDALHPVVSPQYARPAASP